MKEEKALPDTDQAPGASHPRATFSLVGHQAQEAELAAALGSGRMHHAWLLAGAKGLGKASLAYRFARVALGAKPTGPRPLDVGADDPVARRVAALSHPDLFVLRRGYNERNRPRREITIDEARELGAFFALAPAEGGMRVAVVDAVDDLNRNAANALLKTLEEPPARSALILVCHAPGAALATIRSRCRRLALRPLSDAEMRQALGDDSNDGLIRLAKGRPGRAIALKAQGMSVSGAGVDEALAALERGQARALLMALYDKLGGESFERFAALMELACEWARVAAATRTSEAWAEAWSSLETLRIEAEDLDMDVRHALARATGILERAAAPARR